MEAESWAEISQRTMLAILLQRRDEPDRYAIAEAIDRAYPFGERKGYPYKAWLAERREFFAAHSLPIRAKKPDQRQGSLDLRQRVAVVKAGEFIADEQGRARVMAVAEGYAMCRRRNCLPFVVRVSELTSGKWHVVTRGRTT